MCLLVYILDAANWNMQLMLSLNSRISIRNRARLCFQFRNTELCFLQGHVHQAREGIEHTERLLGTHTNAAAGLAALNGLRAELFEFEGALDEAESGASSVWVLESNTATRAAPWCPGAVGLDSP